MREGEAVVVAADLADEAPLRRVLEQPGLVRAVVNVDTAFGVRGDAHVLPGINSGRILEEIENRFVRDEGNVRRQRPGLRRERIGDGQEKRPEHDCAETPDDPALHDAPRHYYNLMMILRCPWRVL